MTEEVKDVEVQKDVKEEHGPYTMEELKTIIEDDPTLREEFLNDEEKFFKEHPLKEASDDIDEEDKDVSDLPAEIQVNVKADWLGDLKDRTPEEAIQEISKGNLEKDKTIDFYKKEKLPQLEGEVNKYKENEATLKKELDEYKKRLKPKDIVIPEVIPIDFEEDDLFISDDGQKKLKDSFVSMNKTIEALTQKLNQPKEKEVEKEVEKEPVDNVQDEYLEIDNFISKKDVFGKPQPMEMMENEFLDFMGNLAKVTSLKGPIQQADGQFTPELKASLQTYLEDKEDEKGLRKALKENSLPELDEGKYKTLNSIYQIREIKNKNNLSYDLAYELFEARNRPSDDELKLKGNLDGHKRYAKAVSKKDQFVKETPASSGGGDTEIMQKPVSDFKEIMAKPSKDWTDGEKHIVRTVYKQQGIDEKELKTLLNI